MSEAILTPSEVAARFGVSAKTVLRWADSGKLPHFRTLGGHRRFRVGDVEAAAHLAASSDKPVTSV